MAPREDRYTNTPEDAGAYDRRYFSQPPSDKPSKSDLADEYGEFGWFTQIEAGPAGREVVLGFDTPMGRFATAMPPDAARQIARALDDAAEQAEHHG